MNNTPIGGGTNRDALPQDPTSEPVLLKITRHIGTAILSTQISVDDNVISLQSGHGFVIGNIIEICENRRIYQSEVIGVSGNDISVNMPIDYNYSVNSIINRCDPNIVVDGSSNRIEFYASPCEGTAWDVYSLILTTETKNEPGPTKYSGITALEKGLYLRKSNGVFKNYTIIRKDSDYRAYGIKYEIDEKSPAGNYLVYAGFDLRNVLGVADRIFYGDKIQLFVQDDLTEGSIITKITGMVLGHI